MDKFEPLTVGELRELLADVWDGAPVTITPPRGFTAHPEMQVFYKPVVRVRTNHVMLTFED